MKLSVIIPFFNSFDNFDRLISSIPDCPDIEVLVIDDHSMHPPVLPNENRNNVHIIQQVEGKKWAGSARNLGLDLCKGQYVLFADSDDYFTQGAFDIIDDFIEENYDLVCFSPISVMDNGDQSLRHIKYSNLVSDYLENKSDAMRYEFFVPWSKLYNMELIKRYNIRFDEVIASNDVMFSLLTGFYAEKIKASKATIYCVVESANSLTKVSSERVVDSRFDVLCRYNNFVKDYLGKKYQVSVASCLSRANKISFFKMLRVLMFSIKSGYPILPSLNGMNRWLKRRMQ